MKKICAITSTRAEYGLIRPVIEKIDKHPDLQLQLFITGTHLEEKYGYTIDEIEKDGYNIDAKAKIICGESKAEIIGTMSKALIKAGEALKDLKPDMIMLDGDRYEMPPIALAAVILNIPVAHIGGGDVTEGAYDDYFRHTLTKLSTLHFPTTEVYRKRIIQMGEDPKRVFTVGSAGVENILKLPLLTKEELEEDISFTMGDGTLLVTFHPVTNETCSQGEQFRELLDALEESTFRFIFTRPNSDTDRDELNVMLDGFVAGNRDRAAAFESMGLLRYLSAMKYCAGVVGNSSSGIVEAPSLKVPTINIGNRQKGRIKAASVIDVVPRKEAIAKAMEQLKGKELKTLLASVKNPYEGANTSARIVEEIYKYLSEEKRSAKGFYDISFDV